MIVCRMLVMRMHIHPLKASVRTGLKAHQNLLVSKLPQLSGLFMYSRNLLMKPLRLVMAMRLTCVMIFCGIIVGKWNIC